LARKVLSNQRIVPTQALSALRCKCPHWTGLNCRTACTWCQTLSPAD